MTDESLKAASKATYAAAADHFDAPALGFWARFGQRTVDRLALRPGDRILDACCGTGASALPAARAVGPQGTVVGVDLAEPALVLARRKAEALGLTNVTFHRADIEHTGLPPASFDAVVCVFGIFFLPDMARALRSLAELVRPGGRIALTVWGPDWVEPGSGAFWDAVDAERPDLVRGFQPWTRLDDSASVRNLLDVAGLEESTVEAEPGWHPVPAPEDWWTIVLGTGLRATVDQLDPEARERVRLANLGWIAEYGVTEVRVDVMYATARTPD